MLDFKFFSKAKIEALFSHSEIEDSPHYLLSQELEFEHAKSILTFSLAFIGGIVTLKTALGIETPIEEGFTFAIILAVLSALFSFEAQQGIIKDLRCGRCPSPLKRLFRRITAPCFLGMAIGSAFVYFE